MLSVQISGIAVVVFSSRVYHSLVGHNQIMALVLTIAPHLSCSRIPQEESDWKESCVSSWGDWA